MNASFSGANLDTLSLFAQHVSAVQCAIYSVFTLATILHVRLELLHLQRHLKQVVMLSRGIRNMLQLDPLRMSDLMERVASLSTFSASLLASSTRWALIAVLSVVRLQILKSSFKFKECTGIRILFRLYLRLCTACIPGTVSSVFLTLE